MTATDLPAVPGVPDSRVSIPDWFRTRSSLVQVAALGLLLLAAAILLSSLGVAGQAVLWETLGGIVAAAVAAILAELGARRATGIERTVRRTFALALGLYLLGHVASAFQVGGDLVGLSALSDVLFLGSILVTAIAFALSIRGRLGPGEELAAFLDALAVSAAAGTLIAAAYGPLAAAPQPIFAAVQLVYPIGFVTIAVLGLVTGLVARTQPMMGGTYLVALGFAILSLAWVERVAESTAGSPAPASGLTYLLWAAIVIIGWGAATWTSQEAGQAIVAAASRRLGTVLPFISVAVVVGVLVLGEEVASEEAQRFLNDGTAILVVLIVARQAVLLRERNQALGRELDLLEQERHHRGEAQLALVAQRESQTRYREVVDVFARLAEQIAFASEERDLVRAAMASLGQIVPTRHGDILLANPSQDRLIVGAAWGWHPAEAGSAAPVDGPLRCPGIRRGTVHSLENAADLLQLACPAHPARSGSVLCVPMLALGQVVGVIHLGRSGVKAFTGDDQRQATRVAEQVALALSNLRLARTMEGMAMSDALTGLHNGRFFDPYLERELVSLAREGQPVGVLVLDIDHFKEFNDRWGHPAGDDALRTFARTVTGALRESDTVARYGGEEFVAALPGADLEAAAAVAEKLRLAVEQMVVELGPGRYARLTVSIGVASTSDHGTDRRTLVKVADQALYQAKQAGRNQIAVAPLPYRSRDRRSSSASGARLRGRSAGTGRNRAAKGKAAGAGSRKTAAGAPGKTRKPSRTGRRDAA